MNKTNDSITHVEGRPEQYVRDTRYNEPKGAPQADDSLVADTIEDNDIYSRAKERILNAQRKQVAYGLDKYPEPLNANTWSLAETIDHIIDESVDKLHYLMMLKIKLEHEAGKHDDALATTMELVKGARQR